MLKKISHFGGAHGSGACHGTIGIVANLALSTPSVNDESSYCNRCCCIQAAQNEILKNQQILASNQMKIEQALIVIYNHLQKFPARTPAKVPGSVGGVDSEGKPWSINIDRMASMNKDLRKSKACYLRCLSEFGFPEQESEGTIGVISFLFYITYII